MSQSRTIRGEPHQLILLRILEWDSHGRPSKAEIGYDDSTFHLSETTPNEYLTAYVKEDVIRKATRQ